MKYIYQILSYAVVIIITAIVVSNLKFASNLDYKNEIENLHKQNDSLKANIDSNKVIIKSLSSEIITYKSKIENDKKELANLKIKAKKNKDKYNEDEIADIIKKIDENEKFFKAFFLTGIITTIFSGIAALIIFIIAPYAIISEECRKIRRNPIVQISTFFFKGIILINTLIQESPPGPTTKQLKQLNELKMAHDNGYISDIDYEQRVQSIRDQIR